MACSSSKPAPAPGRTLRSDDASVHRELRLHDLGPSLDGASGERQLAPGRRWRAQARSPPRHPGALCDRMMLPFTENFASTTLDPAWTVHLAKANLLQVADGVLKLEARPGTRAHFAIG